MTMTIWRWFQILQTVLTQLEEYVVVLAVTSILENKSEAVFIADKGSSEVWVGNSIIE